MSAKRLSEGRPISVVHVTPEVLPFSSTGGLGVVLGALPSALARVGVSAAVITPKYADIKAEMVNTGVSLNVTVGRRTSAVGVFRAERPAGVPVYLLDCPEAYDRPGVYGPTSATDHADNAWRYALLAQGAIELCRKLRLHPDILHGHDWASGLLPLFAERSAGNWVRTVMTIHNLGYQGTFPSDTVEELGLQWSQYTPAGFEYWGWLSFLKAGLVFADRVTTVSPTYADEVRTPQHGMGLHGVLLDRGRSLIGIMNGVDYDRDSPDKDAALPARYDSSDLSGKAICKAALLEQFGLTDSGGPVLGVVSRLVAQKGMDLLAEAVEPALTAGARLIVMGTGEPAVEALLTGLAQRWPHHVAVRIAYEDGVSRLIRAGSDAILMPSRYEPCGLTQLFALRYGTLPVVRATGGLADSVVDGETGFAFTQAAPLFMAGALDRLMQTWRQPERWRQMQLTAMAQDFSWARSAQQYRQLYEEVLEE